MSEAMRLYQYKVILNTAQERKTARCMAMVTLDGNAGTDAMRGGMLGLNNASFALRVQADAMWFEMERAEHLAYDSAECGNG